MTEKSSLSGLLQCGKLKYVLLALGIFAGASITCSIAFAGEAEVKDIQESYSKDRILVVFEDNVTKKEAKKLLKQEDLDQSAPNYLYDSIASVEIPSGADPLEAIDRLESQKAVKLVQPDYIHEYDGYTSDPEISSSKYSSNFYKYHYIFQMGLAGPGLTAWNYAKGSGVNVAIIDSGANVSHQDLKQNVKGAYNAVTETEGLDQVKDNKGHGSRTAGILAARGDNGYLSAGIACKANLYIVKVEPDDGSGIYTSDIIKGIRWAVEKKNCRVISLSISGDMPDPAAEEIIRQIYNNGKGTLVVCSAGNEGTGSYRYPASYREALSVSALTYTSSGYQISSKSNYNDQINVAAPGSGLYGVSNTSNTKIAQLGSSYGVTSAAAPYTAGVAALIFSANPELTAAQCKEILEKTAKDAGAPGKDVQYGYGIIDPLAAVQNAKLKTIRDFTLVYREIRGVKSAYKKSASGKAFSLNASFEGSGVLSYNSSNPKVAKVSSRGAITPLKPGKTTITVSLPQSGIYRAAASKKAVLTVVPKKASISKLESKSRAVKVTWKRDKKVSGYQVVLASDKKFTKGKKQANIKTNKTVQKTFTKLSKGKVYYMKVRSYKTVGKQRLYGPYSKAKAVRVK